MNYTLFVTSICQYTIAICVFQCIVALGNDLYKPLKMFLDHYINQGQDFLDSVHRMYGIGATLDTAGIRFSCALVMIAYLIINQDNTSKRRNLVLLIISYLIIAIIGNMIARTTSVGLIVSFCTCFARLVCTNLNYRLNQKDFGPGCPY